METIKWAVNHMPKTEDANLKVMALDEIAKARSISRELPAVQRDAAYEARQDG